MGTLIVIDGLDGSGKSTQSKLLADYLKNAGFACRQIKLPDYNDDSSSLVKMYLNGEFGENPDSVNAYAASSFYAVDRYASFARHWKGDYDSGAVIVSDRYTTSNAIHQASKLDDDEADGFLYWLFDYEYRLLGIPEPKLVIFLDMKPSVSQKLLSKRYEGDEEKKDIHEKNIEYLNKCRKSALYAAQKYGWSIVKCYENDRPLTIDEIFLNIKNIVDSVLELNVK